jgi:uncharacterized protein YndB with AHSA1/START domain
MTGRTIHLETTIHTTIDKAWNCWTTNEGIRSFFAPECDVELKIGGKFEMYFLLQHEKGLRGSEDCKILSYLPEKMLSFSWNAPPEIPTIRKQRTWVVLHFEVQADEKVCVTLDNLGYGQGDDWNEAYDYFCNAWKSVLYSMKKTLESNNP